MSMDMGGFPVAQSTTLDYVQRTTDLTVTATTAATANAWINGNPVVYDGNTRIRIEGYAWTSDQTPGDIYSIVLYDGSTEVGKLCQIGNSASTTININLYVSAILTPTNGVHTYNLKAYKSGGTTRIYASTGGSNTGMPAWLRITKA